MLIGYKLGLILGFQPACGPVNFSYQHRTCSETGCKFRGEVEEKKLRLIIHLIPALHDSLVHQQDFHPQVILSHLRRLHALYLPFRQVQPRQLH